MKNFMITFETVNEIEDMVYEALGYFDEYTYSQALYIVEYALGMKTNYPPEIYMYDIFNHFGISSGVVQNKEMVEYLINKHLEHGEDAWGDSMVICNFKELLKEREQNNEE